MSENTTPGGDPLPPKLNLKPQNPLVDLVNATPVERDAKHHTAKIDLPAIPPETNGTLKKKTSRIPLDQVSAEPGAPSGSPVPGVGTAKTIRLTNPPSSPTITIVPSSKAIVGTMILDDAKRQTSRIPLESATTGSGESGDQPAIPKTIRIKRPTVTQSVPVPAAPLAQPTSPAQESPFAPKSSTARIDLPEQEMTEEGGQVTQRKTIKIRRADGSVPAKPGPRSPVVARMEQEAAEHAAEAVSAPHPIFPTLAAVAIVLLCVLVYVLCVQAFPNLNWSFPGKISL
jgi:hypothetical protein